MSPSKDKEFFAVESAGHYEMYQKPEYVGPAVDWLTAFFERHLGSKNPFTRGV